MQPAVQPSAADIREELGAICAHRRFVKSGRLSQFLRFIVEQKLSGHNVNEQLIGASVFGREPGYDSANDTIVRTQAVELRKRLEDYYRDNPHARVRISIARGTYNPSISWVYDQERGTAEIPHLREEISTRHDATRTRRRIAVALVAGAVALAAAVAIFVIWRSRQRPAPSAKYPVVLADVVNATGDTGLGDTLRRTLSIQLEQMPLLHVLPDAKVATALKMMIAGKRKTECRNGARTL